MTPFSHPPIPLEDSAADVATKAMRGLGLDEAALAARAGLPPSRVASALAGEARESEWKMLASALGLSPRALAALAAGPEVQPPPAPEGLAGFNAPFGGMTVNSYLAWDTASRQAVAFDAGADASPILDVLRALGLELALVLITHTHGDHVYDLDRLIERTGAEAWACSREPMSGLIPFMPGAEFEVGTLKIRTRLTWGHSPGGITYVVTGLPVPVAVVGDALFARSMGGAKLSYEAALQTNRQEILSLPEETILCPGHGPATTVAEELRYNPFFATG